mgnify:CR=1 FL=1
MKEKVYLFSAMLARDLNLIYIHIFGHYFVYSNEPICISLIHSNWLLIKGGQIDIITTTTM